MPLVTLDRATLQLPASLPGVHLNPAQEHMARWKVMSGT